MTENYIHIEFVYPSGQSQGVLDELSESLERYDEIDSSRVVIKPKSFGSIKVGSYAGVNDHWPLEEDELTYESPQRSISLADSPTIEYSISDLQYLKGGEEHPLDVELDEPLREFINIMEICYMAVDERPIAVYSFTPDTPHDLRKPPITAESIAEGRLLYLPWLAIFTPQMIDYYGRETLLSAPAWKVEELNDGSIMTVCHDNVLDWMEDCRDVADHIGLPWHGDM
ncbi:hypothetical protein [Halococcoides cellulosivorans]|uniref:hypothetical protein n=1 Tax=Halococcoides cellulosivorans TaxID=1679096 RepID=UPI00131F36ED|nr:hypothetical protein [Halococcoides cellulosivorans]